MADIYKDLFEAYQTVYVPQEVDEATAMAKRGHDETKLRKRAGGGEAADRATSLENKPTYGDKNKEAQRSGYARAQRGDFRKTSSSNPGLHVGQHKSDDPTVKAKQAARGAQRGALTPNERKQLNMGDESFDVFDVVLEFLQAEGYAETLEEAEWVMANVIDEEAIEIILGEEQLDELSHDTYRSVAKKQSAKVGALQDAGKDDTEAQNRLDRTKRLRKKSFVEPKAPGARNPYAEEVEQIDEISQKLATKAYAQSATGEFEGHDDASDIKRTDNLRKHIKRKFGDKAAEDADRHADSETFGRKDPRTGKRQGHAKPRIEKNRTYRTTKAGSMHGQDQAKLKSDLKKRRNEEFVGEAQEARNNPEKYEADQKKKTAPVRGERTPMPPRGDKRREDFEKWYAKNVR